MAAAFGAGVTGTIVTNPLSVVRSRILLSSSNPATVYGSLMKSLLRIAQKEGLSGFYKVISQEEIIQ